MMQISETNKVDEHNEAAEILSENAEQVEALCLKLNRSDFPLLSESYLALSSLKKDKDNLLPRTIAPFVLQDPLATLFVIKYLAEHVNRSRQTEITTVEHALMMLGVEPFFKSIESSPTVKQMGLPSDVLQAIYNVSRRSFVASEMARKVAKDLKDLEPEEVQIAALLHDMSEIFLWLYEPQVARKIQQLMKENPTIRSAALQRKALGFTLASVEQALSRLWHLPTLTQELIAHKNVEIGKGPSRRLRTVQICTQLVRHLGNSWKNAALKDDFLLLTDLLKEDLSAELIQEQLLFVRSLVARWDDLYDTESVGLAPFGGGDFEIVQF